MDKVQVVHRGIMVHDDCRSGLSRELARASLMSGKDEALHVGEYLVLKVLPALVPFLKIIEEEWELLSILADQVKHKLLLQSVAQL